MRVPVLLLSAAAASLAASGCGNACQQECDVIADIFEACGRTFGDSELSDCKADYRAPDAELLQTCRHAIATDRDGVTNLEKDWTCETLDDLDATFADSGDGG